jgi:hypothetical protein
MATSRVLSAKRALVKVVQWLAGVYGLSLQVTGDSIDPVVKKAFLKVALKAHPDKCGNTAHTQKLLAAKASWETAKKAAKKGGRPKDPAAAAQAEQGPAAGQGLVACPADRGEPRGVFRVQAQGVLLTYFGLDTLDEWYAFVSQVRSKQKARKVKHWCATCEETKAGRKHVHLMLQFCGAVEERREEKRREEKRREEKRRFF